MRKAEYISSIRNSLCLFESTILFIIYLYIVRITQQLSLAPANVNFPRIARALSFKPIWNVTAAFIGWKVSVKKACDNIHIAWHAIKIYWTPKETLQSIYFIIL